MPAIITSDQLTTNETNIAFYDKIASAYDTILDQENSNQHIRQRVAEKFMAAVKQGCVLDFGGGTGRDLNWLVKNNYRVIFCEPSAGMREKAINLYKNDASANITFLKNDEIDFTKWLHQPPFLIKADAVLADFAVLNNIADLNLLFKTMAQILRPKGHFMALVLNKNYKKSLLWKAREYIRQWLSKKPQVVNITYNGYNQTVYVYSRAEIMKASKIHFDTYSEELLQEFTLFHFIKN